MQQENSLFSIDLIRLELISKTARELDYFIFLESKLVLIDDITVQAILNITNFSCKNSYEFV